MTEPFIIDSGKIGGESFLRLGGCGEYSVNKTFDCGQCFRFDKTAGDGEASVYSGIAFGKKISLSRPAKGELLVRGATEEEYSCIWKKYLALDTDYDAVDRGIIDAMQNENDRNVLSAAVECGKGIRILRQDPFEALISFIISQNNNIPRIKKIISALSEKYGQNGAFPTPEALVEAGVDGLFELKTGFRAAYIFDAASKISSGEISLDEVDRASFSDATDILCKIKGVGPKVSACVLLFGFGKTEAFPVDVWMKRSLERHFPNGFDHTRLGRHAGIAQQYLFYYERWGNGEI